MKIEDLKVDDVLVAKDGIERTVLAVCGKICALSFSDDSSKLYGWYTAVELETHGLTLKKEPTLADKLPDGEMVLVRDNTEDTWDARFSCGRLASGRLVCRTAKDAMGRPGSAWGLARKFDENLLGEVTK